MSRTKAGDSKEARTQALDNAQSWLTMVDDGHYDQSWDVSAKPLRSAFSKTKWLSSVGSLRTSAGGLQSRDLKTAEYKTSLKDAPDDEYYIIHLDTAFENKASATEILVMRLEEDAAWRVATYFVK